MHAAFGAMSDAVLGNTYDSLGAAPGLPAPLRAGWLPHGPDTALALQYALAGATAFALEPPLGALPAFAAGAVALVTVVARLNLTQRKDAP